jgi:hypothetical protein
VKRGVEVEEERIANRGKSSECPALFENLKTEHKQNPGMFYMLVRMIKKKISTFILK